MPETLCLCGIEASDCPRAESPQLALVDGVDLKVLEGLERTVVFDAIGFKHIQYECPCEGFAMELRKYLCGDRYFVTHFVKWVLLGTETMADFRASFATISGEPARKFGPSDKARCPA